MTVCLRLLVSAPFNSKSYKVVILFLTKKHILLDTYCTFLKIDIFHATQSNKHKDSFITVQKCKTQFLRFKRVLSTTILHLIQSICLHLYSNLCWHTDKRVSIFFFYFTFYCALENIQSQDIVITSLCARKKNVFLCLGRKSNQRLV